MERISSNDASMENMLARLKEQKEAAKTEWNKGKTESPYNLDKKKMNLSTYMIRLANARTPIQVDGVIRSARIEARSIMCSAKSTSREVSAAKRVARRIEDKGTVKIFRLRKEKSLKRLSDQYKHNGKLNKANDTLKLLKKKQRARKAEEQIDVVHSIKSDKAEETYAQMQEGVEAELVNSDVAVSVDISGAEAYLMDGGMSEGGIDCLL